MDRSILVYSPDEIRCQIISKTLAARGFEPTACTTHFEAQKAVAATDRQAAVLDFAKDLSHELDFRDKLVEKLPQTPILVLTTSQDAPILEKNPVPYETHLPVPLDPELVHTCVQSALSAMARADNEPSGASSANEIRTTAKSYLSLVLGAIREGAARTARRLLKAMLLSILVSIGVALGALLWCYSELPDVELLKIYSPYKASQVYSRDNVLLSEFYIERRHYLPRDQIPEMVKKAVMAIEDQRYLKHRGIDLIRIAGALYTDIRQGRYAQGASTLTQQLAKMVFLTPEKTLTRKAKEILLSLKIEHMYTKEEILELYLNKAYFGPQSYGIAAASASYFGKAVKDLTLAEAALLAGVLRAPSEYSPFKNPDLAAKRRERVLKCMLALGYIANEDYTEASNTPLPQRFHGTQWKAPYFVDYCKGLLDQTIGKRLYTSGLTVYATLDARMQGIAEEAVESGIRSLTQKEGGEIQAALLAVELATGKIRAMVGGRLFSKSQFNRATQAKRQPGSAFKPVVYLAALLEGYGPETILEDRVTTYWSNGGRSKWTPKNYTRRYLGEVSMETALSKSLNAATVDLAYRIGIDAIVNTAAMLGIQSDIYPVYPSALGASEVTLLELVYAYAALATGHALRPLFVEQIIDSHQAVLLQPHPVRQRILDDAVVEEIRCLLAAVTSDGTGAKARQLGIPVYGKTGTTNKNADALFIGFDDQLAVGVWVGRDDNTSIGSKQTGASAALPIWMDFMANYTERGDSRDQGSNWDPPQTQIREKTMNLVGINGRRTP
jgi:penicillin-binding protein 1A